VRRCFRRPTFSRANRILRRGRAACSAARLAAHIRHVRSTNSRRMSRPRRIAKHPPPSRPRAPCTRARELPAGQSGGFDRRHRPPGPAGFVPAAGFVTSSAGCARRRRVIAGQSASDMPLRASYRGSGRSTRCACTSLHTDDTASHAVHGPAHRRAQRPAAPRPTSSCV